MKLRGQQVGTWPMQAPLRWIVAGSRSGEIRSLTWKTFGSFFFFSYFSSLFGVTVTATATATATARKHRQ